MLANMWTRTDMFIDDIATALKRTPMSVRRHARAKFLGSRPPVAKKKVERAWSPEDVVKLLAFAHEGRLRGFIAERLQRRVESVLSKASQLNITILDRSYAWSGAEIEHLRKLVVVDRLADKEIFAILNRSPHAILSKIRDLNLGGFRNKPSAAQRLPIAEVAVTAPEPAETGPEPLWKAPPYVAWPPPVFGSAPTCQYPLWGHTAPPRPAPFCDKKSFRDSFCDEHWLRCHTPRTDREAAE